MSNLSRIGPRQENEPLPHTLRIVEVDGPMDTPCWEWIGAKHHGYGTLNIDGKTYSAHRIAYMLFVGPISETRVIDHLCRNTACINPFHLESVSDYINSIRGVHPLYKAHIAKQCTKGHPIEGQNVAFRPDGRAKCKLCDTLRRKAREVKRQVWNG